MRVSQQVLEWKAEASAEAKLENQRANLLRALEKRCKAPVPNDLAKLIEATLDMSLLLFWFDAALEANTFDEFRNAIHKQN